MSSAAALGDRDHPISAASHAWHDHAPQALRALVLIRLDDPADVGDRHDVRQRRAQRSGQRDRSAGGHIPPAAPDAPSAMSSAMEPASAAAPRGGCGPSPPRRARRREGSRRPSRFAKTVKRVSAGQASQFRDKRAHIQVDAAHRRVEEQGVDPDVPRALLEYFELRPDVHRREAGRPSRSRRASGSGWPAPRSPAAGTAAHMSSVTCTTRKRTSV